MIVISATKGAGCSPNGGWDFSISPRQAATKASFCGANGCCPAASATPRTGRHSVDLATSFRLRRRMKGNTMTTRKPRGLRGGVSYRQIATTLMAEIDAGDWAIGAQLPTESDLVDRFGVSRGTIREALRELHDFGYLSKRRGTRSVVIRAEVQPKFVNSAQTLDDMLEYARLSHNRLLASEMVLLSDRQAAELDCEPGSEWLRIQVLRTREKEGLPFSYSEIFVARRYREIGDIYD